VIGERFAELFVQVCPRDEPGRHCQRIHGELVPVVEDDSPQDIVLAAQPVDDAAQARPTHPKRLVRRGCHPAVDERTVGIMTLTVVIVLLILVCGAAAFMLWRRRGGG
jgi:hypothetical protein